MEFKKLEQKAKEIRGDGPLLGRNVLAVGFETSFPGTDRPTTIKGSDNLPLEEIEAPALRIKPKLDISDASAAWGGQFIHGISAPMSQLEAQMAEHFKEEQVKEIDAQRNTSEQEHYMAQPSDELMKAANLGVVIPPREEAKPPSELDAKRFKKTKGKPSKKGSTRKR
jgi:hypothetical protein